MNPTSPTMEHHPTAHPDPCSSAPPQNISDDGVDSGNDLTAHHGSAAADHAGFFAKLKRSFTVGSSPSAKKTSESSGVFARLRRSFTTSRNGNNSISDQSKVEAKEGGVGFQKSRSRSVNRKAYSGRSGDESVGRSHSQAQHRRSSSMSITAPLRKMRDSYMSCMMALDSQLLDSGIAGGGGVGGVGDLYDHHYFANYASLSTSRHRQTDEEGGGRPFYASNLMAKTGGDVLRFPSDAQMRHALRNSKHYKEAIVE